MSESIALQELARQVRGKTIQLLTEARPEWLTWAPPGTSNHILWHAGHAIWLQDVLCLQPLTGQSSLPEGWAETFGMDCRPVKSTTEWPSVARLQSLLREQLERMLEALAAADDLALAKIANTRGDTLAARIIHGLHDEAKHQGEMYLLLKLCRARDAI
jgi:hypothetical protein